MYKLIFNTENRLASVKVGTSQPTVFAYDADGQRVMTTQPNRTKVYTPFPDYEETVPASGGATKQMTFSLAGQIIAVRVITATTNDYYYAYTDQLGNVSAWTTPGGALVSGSLARYDPYGIYRTEPGTNVNPGISDWGFTGHRMNNTNVNDLGLIYMNARYYLPEAGRFISADTIVPDPSNPQSFNRYSYSYNNPINYTDPSGHCIFGIDTAICVAAATGAVVSLIVDYGFQFTHNLEAGMDVSEALHPRNIDLPQLAGATVAGGLGGAIAGPIGGLASKSSSLLARIGVSALGGAAGGVIGGQAGKLTEATVAEISDYYHGYGFNQDDLFQQAADSGFLDPNAMVYDAATGAVYAGVGESLRSVLNGISRGGRYQPLPMVGFEPVSGKGIQGKIYYQNREVVLDPTRLQAFINALSLGTRDMAIDLLTEWFGTEMFED
ncbi:MAG TPA: RHS repeat-associated core domain-containing protein [Promineifilum sp.]|nr:RHS repeat-associated core domain-containing protein [Promineifilum sp.]